MGKEYESYHVPPSKATTATSLTKSSNPIRVQVAFIWKEVVALSC
jgi:hypothetical protein